MGLAVYNSIILDIHFPLCCYKKLLGKSKRSRRRWQEQQRDRTVGHVDLGLHDLIELKPVRVLLTVVANRLVHIATDSWQQSTGDAEL